MTEIQEAPLGRRAFMGIDRPSQALRAMCDGLEEADSRPDFEIDMSTYGEVRNNICFGCAATCALQELLEEPFTALEINDRYISGRTLYAARLEPGWDFFEFAIDEARKARLHTLFEFFGVEDRWDSDLERELLCMGTSDWRGGLPAIRRLIDKLEPVGL